MRLLFCQHIPAKPSAVRVQDTGSGVTVGGTIASVPSQVPNTGVGQVLDVTTTKPLISWLITSLCCAHHSRKASRCLHLDRKGRTPPGNPGRQY